MKHNEAEIKKLKFFLSIFILVIAGCNKAYPPSLLLYCGAGLRPPVSEIVDVFEKEKGLKIECIYNASNLLLSQIKLSRKGDVFIPGDVFYVEQAKIQGFIEESRVVAYFIPVILVKKGNPNEVVGLKDFTKKGLRLGIGDFRACAVGRITQKIFEKNNISLDDIAANIVFTSATVNELADAVKLGHIDAAVVWDGVAQYYKEDSDIIAIPQKENIISSIPVAVLKTSENKAISREFLEFVSSEKGKEIFKKHHYTTNVYEFDRR